MPPEVLDHLMRLPWRGNVRELENVLTRAVVLAPGEVLLSDALPVADAPNGTPQRATDLQLLGRDPSDIPTLAEAERVLILRALEAADGHKGKVCQILGISRPTLERKLHKHGISRGEQDSDKGA